MKIRIVYIVFLSSIALIGCRKDNSYLLSLYPQLEGDYNWRMTYMSNGEILSTETTSDRFGVRFSEKGKAKLYWNGKLYQKGDIVNINEGSNANYYVFSINADKQYMFKISDEGLTSYNYPVQAVQNFYDKIE